VYKFSNKQLNFIIPREKVHAQWDEMLRLVTNKFDNPSESKRNVSWPTFWLIA